MGDDLFVDIPERHVKVLEREMVKSLNPVPAGMCRRVRIDAAEGRTLLGQMRLFSLSGREDLMRLQYN